MRKFIPKPAKVFLNWLISCASWDQWAMRSWSQEGEDQILRRIFEQQTTGFYVDVGAHHPKRFSNTYLFYRRGWSGINIDAMPGSMQAFREVRPRDVNLELGVGLEAGEKEYYIFNEPALNGFSKQLSMERENAHGIYKIIDVKTIKVEPLDRILGSNLKYGQNIDFLSVDVEGLDLEVLKSNNWTKYRPQYVLVEVLGSSLQDIGQNDVSHFMISNGYEIYAKCINTIFFKRVIT
jgi:FkbM family methyltransferase